MEPSPSKLNKRSRSTSTNQLLLSESPALSHPHVKSKSKGQPLPSNQPPTLDAIAAPLLPHLPGMTKLQYFNRLDAAIDRSLFSTAHSFEAGDGLYLYKRPVRSASPQHAMLLAQAGSVFHHVVLYLKQGQQLLSMEYFPSNGMDVTQNFLDEVPAAAQVVNPTPDLPEPQFLPMLHIAASHHPLEAPFVQQALQFAASRHYQAIKNNCIAFADFAVRVFTGNRVKNAPLIYDHLVGSVPATDSPLLPLLQAMTQMSWFHVADGSRLMLEYLRSGGALGLVHAEGVVGVSGGEDEEAGVKGAASESALSADTMAGGVLAGEGGSSATS